MLVLTRKAGESIVIGNDVVITVLEVRGGQIRLGVDAPRNLAVHRAEIYQQVMAEGVGSVSFHDTEANGVFWHPRASARVAGFKSHPTSASLRAPNVPCKGFC